MTHPTVPLRLYVGIFAALILLTGLTVGSLLDLGGGASTLRTPLAAITIAVAKGSARRPLFMHVRYSSRLTWIFVGAGVFWFAILIVLTLADYLSRGWFPNPAPGHPDSAPCLRSAPQETRNRTSSAVNSTCRSELAR